MATVCNDVARVHDEVEISLALRYDEEQRDVTNLVPTDATTQFVLGGGAPLNPGLALGPILPKSETFDQLQPKLSATWDATDRLTLFGSWGVGFKSGGFNNQGSEATVDFWFNTLLGLDLVINDQFREETSSSFEVGFKADVSDDFYLEGALYSVDVDDMQFFEFLVGPFGLLRVVSNIDEVSIQGVELGFGWRASNSFNVYGGVNITDSEIDKNASRPATVGNESPYTPDMTANLGLDFSRPVSNQWVFTASAYTTLVGDTWFHTVQEETRRTLFDLFLPTLGTANYTPTKRDSYQTIDLRVGLATGRWGVTLFAHNVTDEEYLEEVITAPEFGGSFIHPGSQSRVGVELAFRY